jgi:cytochrome c biogenesis protein CcmG, thiol:disulfide interchange protein DsbE
MSARKAPLPRSARFTYLAAVVAAAAIVTTAWVARDRFTPLGPGSRAPDFTYPGLDGNPVSLSDYRGQVVLVNLWATWCPPCREEMPSMERLYQAMEGKPFEILAVSVDAPEGGVDSVGREGGNLRSFADELGLTFPILHDPSMRIQGLYQATGFPESFVVGKDGVIYRKVFGSREWDTPDMIEFIERLVDG